MSWTCVFIGFVAGGGAPVGSTFRARIREMTGVWVIRPGRMIDCVMTMMRKFHKAVTSGDFVIFLNACLLDE